MTKPTIRIHDLASDKVIDREMTDAEFTKYEADLAAVAAETIAEKNKGAAKAEILARLGITADEAKLLLG